MKKFYPREAKLDLLYTIRIIFSILTLVTVFLAVYTAKSGYEYGVIMASPRKAEGRLIESLRLSDYAIRVRYEYIDFKNSTQQFEETIFHNPKPQQDPAPERHDVTYAEWDPSIAQFSDKLSEQQADFFVFIGSSLVTLLLIILIFWTLKKINDHRQADTYY